MLLERSTALTLLKQTNYTMLLNHYQNMFKDSNGLQPMLRTPPAV